MLARIELPQPGKIPCENWANLVRMYAYEHKKP